MMTEEKLHDLPKGWVWTPLIDIAEINPKLPHNNIKDEDIVSFIPMKAVQALTGEFVLSVRKYHEVKKGYTPFINNDVIFAKITPCMENGKIAVVNGLHNEIGFGSTEFHVIRSDEVLLNQNYLLYYFIQDAFREKAKRNMTGSAGQLRVPVNYIKNLSFPLPPNPEQQRIVNKIEELFTKLDAGIESLKKVKAQMKRYRQAVLKYAFEGNLTAEWREANKHQLEPASALLERIKEEKKKNTTKKQKEILPEDTTKKPDLTENWVWVRFCDLAHATGGYAFKSNHFKNGGKYQVIRIGNVRPGVLRLNEKPCFIDSVDETTKIKYLLNENDVIITLTGTRKKRDYGYTALVKKQNLLLNQRLACLRFFNEEMSKYFLYYSYTDLFKDQFFEYETGNVGQGNVGMKAIQSSYVPVCSSSEREMLVREIERRFSIADRIEEIVEQNLKKAERLRQSILKRAFEGKLVTQDPSDEPAVKLLELIKAEKEQEEVKKTKPKRSRK